MNIKISMISQIPIYQQIINELKKEIVNNLAQDMQLPSIRTLAKELEVGIITVKKAYEQLVIENYIYSKSGVGYFVKKLDMEKIYQENLNDFREELKKLLNDYKEKNLSLEVLESIINSSLKEVYQNDN